MKRILGCMRDACGDFGLISDGDRIAVGVSGGKDSIVLLNALSLYRNFSPVRYSLVAVTLDMGLFCPDTEAICDFCADIGVEYHVEHTNIGNVVFEARGEHNPCSLCANMKRGALCNAANQLGCRKLALGHHFDDAVETLFLNLFYEGRLALFAPKSYLDRSEITLIRPLIYAYESDISACAERCKLPVFKSGCPADKATKREEIKMFIKETERKFPDLRHQCMTALKNESTQNLWKRSECE